MNIQSRLGGMAITDGIGYRRDLRSLGWLLGLLGGRQKAWSKRGCPETYVLTLSLPEVDRAIDNLVKSGKMFGMPGRRESNPARNASPAAARYRPDHGEFA